MSELVARRVMIVGGSGSGKTWLAMRLSAMSKVPVYHADQMRWRPRFEVRKSPELIEMTREVHARPHWLLEGGLYETGHERAARAHALIWIEVPLPTRILRVIWRAVRYNGQVRPGMADGCRQRLGKRTLRVMRHAWQSPHIHRPRIEQIIADSPPHLRVIHLRSGRQARRFLRACRPAPDGPGVILPA